MESGVGGVTNRYQANRISFFAASGWRYLWMVAFGMGAGGIAECRRATGNTGMSK
jgi:hypothetical protein